MSKCQEMMAIKQKVHWHRFIKTKKYNYASKHSIIEKLDGDNGATMFFIAEKQQKTILKFSLASLNVIE